jgi:hypothetical protein
LKQAKYTLLIVVMTVTAIPGSLFGQTKEPAAKDVTAVHEANMFGLAYILASYEQETADWGFSIDMIRDAPPERFLVSVPVPGQDLPRYEKLWRGPAAKETMGWQRWREAIGKPKANIHEASDFFIVSDADTKVPRFVFDFILVEKDGGIYPAPAIVVNRAFFTSMMIGDGPGLPPPNPDEDFLRSWTDPTYVYYGNARSVWELRARIAFLHGRLLGRMQFALKNNRWPSLVHCSTRSDPDATKTEDCRKLIRGYESATAEATYDGSQKLLNGALPLDMAEFFVTNGKEKGIENYLNFMMPKWYGPDGSGTIWSKAWTGHDP